MPFYELIKINFSLNVGHVRGAWFAAILRPKLNHMQTAIQQTFSTTHIDVAPKSSLYSKFMNWCTGQEKYRYGWLGAAITSHGCVITPLTMFAIILSGNNIFFWMLAIVAMMMTLVTNLAALPTKYTIPVFLFSILIDVTVIIACISSGLDITGTYQ